MQLLAKRARISRCNFVPRAFVRASRPPPRFSARARELHTWLSRCREIPNPRESARDGGAEPSRAELITGVAANQIRISLSLSLSFLVAKLAQTSSTILPPPVGDTPEYCLLVHPNIPNFPFTAVSLRGNSATAGGGGEWGR